MPRRVSRESSSTEPALRRVMVEFELPEDLFQMLRGEEGVALRFRERIILDLLDAAFISQERAATMLGIHAFDLLDLMPRKGIPYFTGTEEEFKRDLEVARSLRTHYGM